MGRGDRGCKVETDPLATGLKAFNLELTKDEPTGCNLELLDINDGDTEAGDIDGDSGGSLDEAKLCNP